MQLADAEGDLLQRQGVVDDVIGKSQPCLTADLGFDNRHHLLAADAVAGNHPFDLNFNRYVDYQDAINVLFLSMGLD